MKILAVIDHHGWSFSNICEGIRKYSTHHMDIVTWDSIGMVKENTFNEVIERSNPLAGYDVFLFLVYDGINHICNGFRNLLRKSRCKYILGDWGDHAFELDNDLLKEGYVRAVMCGERKVYNELRVRIGGLSPLFFVKEAVDTEFYRPSESQPPDDVPFEVGWSGNFPRDNKRTHLLEDIKYPLRIQANHGKRFFVKGRDQTEMLDFYQNIDAYIYVSTKEGGCSTTVLEAMACGLPVVCTDAGSETRNLVAPEWIVPVFPEYRVMKEINERLEILNVDKELSRKVGRENRERILENYTWEQRAKEFDRVFELVMGKDNAGKQ